MRAALALALAALLVVGTGSCTLGATVVLVVFDTDAPADRLLSIRATVRNGRGATGDAAVEHWTRGDGGGAITLPASFGVVPGIGQPRDGSAIVTLEAEVRATTPGESPTRFQRVVRFSFTPNQTTVARVFLPFACGERRNGCRNPPPGGCTTSALCDEQGLTCGDRGECVSLDVPTLPRGADVTAFDSGRGDIGLPCDGSTACGASCVDTLSSLLHCGACDNRCLDQANALATCAAGRCGFTCAAGFGDCDGVADNGCETRVTDTPAHCGTCATACAAGAPCNAGVCGPVPCPAGLTMCAAGCVNLQADVSNCGGCGNTCSYPNGSAGCAGAACVLTGCAASWGNCNGNPADGCETALVNDDNNCGACGTVCSPQLGCEGPVCTCTGPLRFTRIPGCTNVAPGRGGTFYGASQASGVNVASHAADGDRCSAWNSGGRAPQWWQTNLGAARTLRGITLVPDMTPLMGDMTLQVQMGNTSTGPWTNAVVLSGAVMTNGVPLHVAFAAASGSFVRVNVSNTSTLTNVAFFEIALWQCP